ncbi:hypothetical protein SCHPADRAFT_641811 [Schizopora paradoxa]|uniref:ER membrane protein complex subunit 7 beta-sandwich domain-containing protein n=1 Tax=Schizopora paradoxa TaxID=27342 RepID=A0A0H2R6Z0_9AGAM|nr:hypothetical protein SCHPADRAFT_641811 [Schizopora paradoxa]
MIVLWCSFLFAFFVSSVVGADVEGRILWNDICKDYNDVGHSRIVLDNGKYQGGLRRDGSFSIYDVDEGSYILSVVSHDYVFDSLRIDVRPDSNSKPQVRPYVAGTPHNPPSTIALPYPITLTPRIKNVYFLDREAFNLLAMLRNPMILMMVVTGGLVMAMPYIMKNMDPELASEVRERQAKFANIQSAMQSGDFSSG